MPEEDNSESVATKEEAPQPEAAPESVDDQPPAEKSPKKRPLPRLISFFKRQSKPKQVGLVTIALVLLLLAIPFTRYQLLGLIVKKATSVRVLDAQSNAPVTDALVSLGGKSAKTDNDGRAIVYGVKIGSAKATISKQYYDTTSVPVFVGLSSGPATEAKLTAQGRPIKIHVVNKISGQAVSNASVKIDKSTAKTDDKGDATLIVAPNSHDVSIVAGGDGYNSTTKKTTIKDNTVVTLEITSAGKLYFLSKLSGKVDVVKTNLDGTDRQTVLAGTGTEDDGDTILLAARDWKFLILKARRDGTKDNQSKLYLIDTSKDSLTTIDEGDASFNLIGWSNHYFMYLVDRNNHPSWQANGSSIKSYNADSGKLTTLDSTNATGNSNDDAKYETYNTRKIHLLGENLTFDRTWYAYPGYINFAGQQNTLVSVQPNGSQKKVIAQIATDVGYYGDIVQYEPNELLVGEYKHSGAQTFYTLDTSSKYTLSSKSQQDDIFKHYPTYLLSPSAQKTFWSEARDGKNTLFIGDADGEHSSQVASLSELTPYGWFSDDYLLTSKKGSELYIMPLKGGTPLKVGDYHKPDTSFTGYGGGYGGL